MEINTLNEMDKDAQTLILLYKQSPKECYRLSKNNNIHIPVRRLYIQSNGIFNTYINRMIGKLRPPLERLDGKTYTEKTIVEKFEQQRIIYEMYESGGYATTHAPLEGIDKLVEELDRINNESESRRVFITEWNRLKRYKVVETLINDRSIKEISDAYLGCNSILNMVVAWRTDPGIQEKQLSSDAMMYHFDSDHNRFLKVFVYLDNVDEATGPHSYAPKTSISFRKKLPDELKRDGRISDSLITKYRIETKLICGSGGTIIFADTHNLHKGTPIRGNKSRYILQLQFVDSLLGATSPHELSDINDMNSGMLL